MSLPNQVNQLNCQRPQIQVQTAKKKMINLLKIFIYKKNMENMCRDCGYSV